MSLRAALQSFLGGGLIRRWTAAELGARRLELERSKPGDAPDVVSALAVAEYLFQHYLPPDFPFTKAKWSRLKVKAEARLREADRAGELTGKAVAEHIAARQAKADARRHLLLRSYEMNQADFVEVVGGLLVRAKFPMSERVMSLLFYATLPDRHSAADAVDALIGEVHPAVIELAQLLRTNYQLLRCAKTAGYEWVMVSPTRRCQCRAGVPHRVHRTDEMLEAYEAGRNDDLVYPSPNLPCLQGDISGVCAISLYPRDSAHLRIDPPFEKWLDDLAAGRTAR